MNKHVNLVFIGILCLSLFCSCGGNSVSREEYDALMALKDSLATVEQEKSTDLNNMNGYLETLSECVDSIAAEQGIIQLSIDPETGKRLTRRELRAHIIAFGDLIKRQREKIKMLSDSLKSGSVESEKISQLTTVIDFLNAQLKAKEAEVNNLKAQLAFGKKNIEQLTANLQSLNETNTMLSSENEALDREIAAQTDLMNEGYILIKTKKELKDMGILKGGFLKKASFQPGSVDISLCQKVDIRTFNDVVLNSEKPKLLSQAPQGSYIFEKTGDKKSILIITDTVAFWSLSNVVIIQL